MTYLSYELQNGIPVAVPRATIDEKSLFFQDGNIYTCCYAGYNVQVFGSLASPDGRLCFQRVPVNEPGYDKPSGDFGMILSQSNGWIAVQWPA